MDLKTRDINNEKQVFPDCIFNGKNLKYFYITKYDNNNNGLLKAAIKYLFVRKYNDYGLCVYNFKIFDGIFMLIVLAKI